jgi:hypothetical protein
LSGQPVSFQQSKRARHLAMAGTFVITWKRPSGVVIWHIFAFGGPG